MSPAARWAAAALALAAGLAFLWTFRGRSAAKAESSAAEAAREEAEHAAGRADRTGLEERLAALEARVDELQRSIASLKEPREPVHPPAADAPPRAVTAAAGDDPLAERGEARIRALQAIALDEARSTRDRALAVEELWEIDRRNGTKGSRTPEIVDALLDHLEFEPEAEVRKTICANVLDALLPRHAPSLLRALRIDPDPSVRAQAADALQDLAADPVVRAALERASAEDASEEVRATAAEMLRRWREAGGPR